MGDLAFPTTSRSIRRFCVPFLAVIALAQSLAFAGVDRWTTSGPAGVSVTSLAVDPANPDRVYAGAPGEVFRSMDGGQSWTTSLSIAYDWTANLAIDPSSSSAVYATTYSGVFRSVDAGGSWAQVGPSSPAFSVAVDPVTPSSVYVGTVDGLFKSDNRGASWSGRLLAASIYSLVFTAQKPSTVFGVDWGYSFYYPDESSMLYKSTDGGATWSSTDTDIFITPGSLAIDPTNSTILYAGYCGGDGADYKCDGVYKSFDAGSSWRQVSTDLVDTRINALVIDPVNPRRLYAGGGGPQGGVFRSIDGGVTWTEFNTGLPDLGVASLAIDRTGTRLYAGTYNGGAFDYQIVPGPVALDLALDLSVGTDNKTRVLFTDIDNRASLRSFETSGNSTSNGPYGPYDGWHPRAVADGLDGLTRVLWTNLDGSAALWLLGPTGIQANHRYGPAAGWTAEDVSVDGDGTTHLLWTSLDGRTGLLSVAVSGAVVNRVTYGPFSGWLARSIANGTDGLTRVLWTKHDGTVGLSLIDQGHLVAAFRFAGAPGWMAWDVAVASDNQTRILSVGADGRMAVWSVDNSGAVTSSGRVYGPVSGQAATRISAGADGLTRVLWTSPQGTGTLWLMDLGNILQSSVGLGLD